MAVIIVRKNKQFLREVDGTEWEYDGPGNRPTPSPSVAAEEKSSLADIAEAIVALFEEIQILKGGE
ncbi:hypothetical protein GJ688_17680 [Heliobacillus mobilis]|uniref:Uncharacterized protein n=1 Tax=Heliobacterium mobile TaxID=28064 RepID=A0A6I3SPZ3_HELMO|nr:hypothetical protein [Heliobacterium mobile]MTV50765.1 hypothetical protein [Heliobacterium mobile]